MNKSCATLITIANTIDDQIVVAATILVSTVVSTKTSTQTVKSSQSNPCQGRTVTNN